MALGILVDAPRNELAARTGPRRNVLAEKDCASRHDALVSS
ncbi:MAG TPA: hypothetical protein VN840_14880 [Streptosporangiaceae bacterium]|nr:hypothetical protein [Streptosporangiaceae bacterium]